MLRRFLLSSLIAQILTLAWTPASFATLASASLDWSQLQIEVVPILGNPQPGLSFLERAASLSTSAFTPGDSNDSHTHTTFNWSTPAHADSITPGARASAAASNLVLSASALSSPVEDPNAPPFPFSVQNIANAQAGRTATLRLDGPAALVLSVPYALEISGGPLYDFDDYATASVDGMVSFQPDVGGAYNNASRSFSLDSRFGAQSETLSGPLIFGLVIDGAGTVSLSWQLAAFTSGHDLANPMTPVPEPAAILQMLAGLLAVGGIALRRSRSHAAA